MDARELHIGFIGFREVGHAFASGLREEGVETVAAYDAVALTPGRGEILRQRAEHAGVRLVSTLEELLAES